jgi:hypothetical protein
MRVWVQSPGSSNIRVCEFRLEFLSYLKKKKKKRKKKKDIHSHKPIDCEKKQNIQRANMLDDKMYFYHNDGFSFSSHIYVFFL